MFKKIFVTNMPEMVEAAIMSQECRGEDAAPNTSMDNCVAQLSNITSEDKATNTSWESSIQIHQGPATSLAQLPEHVIMEIFKYLPWRMKLEMGKLSPFFDEISKMQCVWRDVTIEGEVICTNGVAALMNRGMRTLRLVSSQFEVPAFSNAFITQNKTSFKNITALEIKQSPFPEAVLFQLVEVFSNLENLTLDGSVLYKSVIASLRKMQPRITVKLINCLYAMDSGEVYFMPDYETGILDDKSVTVLRRARHLYYLNDVGVVTQSAPVEHAP